MLEIALGFWCCEVSTNVTLNKPNSNIPVKIFPRKLFFSYFIYSQIQEYD